MYEVLTKNKRTGRDQINPTLSKEIKAALGASKYKRFEKRYTKNEKSSKRSNMKKEKKIKKKWMK